MSNISEYHSENFQDLPEGDFILLSPLPLPTGQSSNISPGLYRDANKVYLDFASKASEIDSWSLSTTLSTIFLTLNLLTLAIFIVLLIKLHRYHLTFFELFINILCHPAPWASMVLGAIFIIAVTVRARIKNLKYPPIRFNRQRREVVYIPKKGGSPIFAPWENIIAGIYHTEFMSVPDAWFELRIGFPNSSDSTITWHSTPMLSLTTTVSNWESIRSYMEYECEQIPDNKNIEKYKIDNEIFRKKHDFVDYFIQRVCFGAATGWTLPLHLMNWAQKVSPMSFPGVVHEWSKPLPRGNWQTPSAELLKKIKAPSHSFRQKNISFDYLCAKAKDKKDAHA